jgi:hypothetical protein
VLDRKCREVRAGRQIAGYVRVLQQASDDCPMALARLGNACDVAVQPLHHLAPCIVDRRGTLEDPAIRHETQKAEPRNVTVACVAYQRSSFLMYTAAAWDEATAATRRVVELLRLDPTVREFTVVYGAVADTNREIAVLGRSILQGDGRLRVLHRCAGTRPRRGARLRRAGRVYGVQRAPEQERLFRGLMAVQHGAERSADAYAASATATGGSGSTTTISVRSRGSASCC